MDPIAVIPDLFPEVEPYNGNTDDNQRFTTDRALSWCKARAGVTDYDLDAAACEESHHAPAWYGWKSGRLLNGLVEPWFGDVFVNPPWDDIGPWVERAWKAWTEPVFDGLTLISISMLLPGNRTHRPWWRDFVEPHRDGRGEHPFVWLATHCPPERFSYGGPGNPRGINAPEPNFTSVLLVLRGEHRPSVVQKKKRKLQIVDVMEAT
jgi:hypothetical protein